MSWNSNWDGKWAADGGEDLDVGDAAEQSQRRSCCPDGRELEASTSSSIQYIPVLRWPPARLCSGCLTFTLSVPCTPGPVDPLQPQRWPALRRPPAQICNIMKIALHRRSTWMVQYLARCDSPKEGTACLCTLMRRSEADGIFARISLVELDVPHLDVVRCGSLAGMRRCCRMSS